MTDMLDLAIEGGKKILCQARGRPAVILAVGVATGLMIAVRNIFRARRDLSEKPDHRSIRKA